LAFDPDKIRIVSKNFGEDQRLATPKATMKKLNMLFE
jgi:hypothetical protein